MDVKYSSTVEYNALYFVFAPRRSFSSLKQRIRLCAGVGQRAEPAVVVPAARNSFRTRFSVMSSTREPGAVARRRSTETAVGKSPWNETETATWKQEPLRL